jgi:uncharacterized protein YcnI
MRLRAFTITLAVVTLVLAPSASAHVTLNPREWEADGFGRFAIRVPNERDNADTTKITLQFPEAIQSAGFQPIDGWRRTVKMVKLDKPIEVEGEQVTERIDTVTWSGGRIRPGEFQEFGVSFRTPSKQGVELAFPAVQTYSNGEVVRWIGPSDADEPAPRVAITQGEPEAGAATPAATAAPRDDARNEDTGRSDTLSIIALIVGVAGLAAGLTALFLRRRPPQAPQPHMEAAAR